MSEGGGGNEAEDEMAGKSKLGRAVLSARIQSNTKFDLHKKSVQCNLVSQDASGDAHGHRTEGIVSEETLLHTPSSPW